MKMRTPTHRERMLAAGATAALIAGLLYVYALEPLILHWRAARDEANAAGAELAELRTLVANRGRIEEQFDRYAGAITRGPSREKLEAQLLKDIESLASQAGVSVTTIKPLAPRDNASMQRIGFEVRAACAAHQFTRLLQLLQEPAHLFQAQSFTLEAGRTDPPLTLSLTLTKLVYVDPAAQAPGAADD